MANRKAIMKAEIVRRPTIDQRAARRDRREYFFVMALFWLVLPAKRGAENRETLTVVGDAWVRLLNRAHDNSSTT